MQILLALIICLGLTAGASAQSLQPGDTLSVSVWQDPKLDRQVKVSPTGMITVPLAGHIRVSGMSVQTVENEIKRRLKGKFSEDLDVTVAFISREEDDETKPRVFVTGEVTKPGPYVLPKKTNLMQAISMAGGFAPFAAKQRVQVRRKVNGVEMAFQFDYLAFESATDFSGNIDIRDGDVIIVPERGLFE
ncbi:MAG: polysaccharide export protein [Blastochloris sp.]|nr:polysaccharide export protein [Blastochloris sp.]